MLLTIVVIVIVVGIVVIIILGLVLIAIATVATSIVVVILFAINIAIAITAAVQHLGHTPHGFRSRSNALARTALVLTSNLNQSTTLLQTGTLLHQSLGANQRALQGVVHQNKRRAVCAVNNHLQRKQQPGNSLVKLSALPDAGKARGGPTVNNVCTTSSGVVSGASVGVGFFGVGIGIGIGFVGVGVSVGISIGFLGSGTSIGSGTSFGNANTDTSANRTTCTRTHIHAHAHMRRRRSNASNRLTNFSTTSHGRAVTHRRNLAVFVSKHGFHAAVGIETRNGNALAALAAFSTLAALATLAAFSALAALAALAGQTPRSGRRRHRRRRNSGGGGNHITTNATGLWSKRVGATAAAKQTRVAALLKHGALYLLAVNATEHAGMTRVVTNNGQEATGHALALGSGSGSGSGNGSGSGGGRST